jgi:hypothetical protein
MNYLTLCADLDRTIDETTWGFGGYSSEAVVQLREKKATQGGQSTMFYDIHWRYPRAYIHQHKLQKQPEGFNQQGPAKVVNLVTTLDLLLVNGNSTEHETIKIQNLTCIGLEKFKMRKIYPVPPHIVADNHFLGDKVMDWLRRKGLALP